MKTSTIALFVILGSITALSVAADHSDGQSYQGICGKNLEWQLDSYGVLTITGSGDMYDDVDWDGHGDDIVSVHMEDSTATSVGQSAFKDLDGIVTVYVDEYLRENGVPSSQFEGCTGITAVYDYSGNFGTPATGGKYAVFDLSEIEGGTLVEEGDYTEDGLLMPVVEKDGYNKNPVWMLIFGEIPVRLGNGAEYDLYTGDVAKIVFQWRDDCVVHFHYGNVLDITDDVLIDYGASVQKPTDEMVWTGYTFRFWSSDHESEYDFSAPVTKDLDIFAIWDMNTPPGLKTDNMVIAALQIFQVFTAACAVISRYRNRE